MWEPKPYNRDLLALYGMRVEAPPSANEVARDAGEKSPRCKFGRPAPSKRSFRLQQR